VTSFGEAFAKWHAEGDQWTHERHRTADRAEGVPTSRFTAVYEGAGISQYHYQQIQASTAADLIDQARALPSGGFPLTRIIYQGGPLGSTHIWVGGYWDHDVYEYAFGQAQP
jgi:hypothetical protein